MSFLHIATFFVVAVGQAVASRETLATITSCTASNNQNNADYHCRNAFDGITTGTSGWAYSGFAPSWANFVMSEPSTVSGLNILSGVGRSGIYRWTDFKISLKVGHRYIEPTNIRVANKQVQVAGGRISGVVYANDADTLLTITFDAVAGVTDVKTCVIVLPSCLLHAAARRARARSLSLSHLSPFPRRTKIYPTTHAIPSLISATCTTLTVAMGAATRTAYSQRSRS